MPEQTVFNRSKELAKIEHEEVLLIQTHAQGLSDLENRKSLWDKVVDSYMLRGPI